MLLMLLSVLPFSFPFAVFLLFTYISLLSLFDVSPSPRLDFVDHVVGNQPDQQMTPIAEWYEKVSQQPHI